MRLIRVIGVVLLAAALLGATVALSPVVLGQTGGARGAGSAQQAQRDAIVAVGPDIQVFGAGGPEIGVTIRDVDKGEGVVVNNVRSDGPAAKAGMKAGDIIVDFDGERVRSALQMTLLVEETPAGRSVKVGVMRDGKRMDLTVTPAARAASVWSDQLRADTEKLRGDLERGLRDLPDRGNLFRYNGNAYRFRLPDSGQFELLPPEGSWGLFERYAQPSGRLGVTVQEMTPQLAAYFAAKEGVLVTTVLDGSAAAKGGLKAGDIITAVGDHPVKASADLSRLVREAASDAELAISVVRDRKPLTLKVRLEPPASSSPRARVIRRTIVV